MNKQLIVVVHGVGVKSAGVSTDLLSAALQDDPAPSPLARATSSPRFPPHSSDDFQMRELDRYSDHNKSAVFPARIRRYREYANPAHTVVTRERVIVDFFWGDITAIMPGAPGVVLGFFKIAMGLSHAIRENAREIFPGSGRLDVTARSSATGAALLIHGPIVASNLVLLLGLLAAWASRRAGGDDGWAIFATSLTAMAGGLLAQKYMDSFLARFLASWVFVFGLALSAIALVDAWSPTTFSAIDARLKELSCSLASDGKDACKEYYKGIYLLGLRIFAAQVIFWFTALGLTLAVIAASLWRPASESPARAINLLAPAIGLMILLWFLFISAIWATAGGLGTELIPSRDMVTSALRETLPASIGIVALAIIGGWILWKKQELQRMDPSTYMKQPDVYAERYRLLVNRAMLGALIIFFVLVVWIALHGVSSSCVNGLGPWPVSEICSVTTRALRESTGILLAGLALLASIVIATGRAEFAAGVGVAADVLAYLNDYSWGARDADGKAIRRPTWLERILPSFLVNSDPKSGYWLRQRIQDRLKVLMTQLIIDEQPDKIVIVAHSQGTVIALDVIAQEGRGWLQALPKEAELNLVTMGSPYTHLYHHYFRSSFPAPETVPALRQRTGGDGSREASLSRWVNIFRIDDFVGTHVGAGVWPTERPVPPNGHTMYWVDRNVLKILQNLL